MLFKTFDSSLYIYQRNIALKFLQTVEKKTDLKCVRDIFEFDGTREQRETVYASKPSRFSGIWFTRGMDNFGATAW